MGGHPSLHADFSHSHTSMHSHTLTHTCTCMCSINHAPSCPTVPYSSTTTLLPTPKPLAPPTPGYGPQLWQASVLSLTLFIALISIIFISVILIAGQDARSNMVPVCLCFSMCKCVSKWVSTCVFSVLLLLSAGVCRPGSACVQ
ncbi:hypothetical protein AMECASPLE_017719 [Ameca splendens]|uniref:Uncharacterized protein n=1 Tax=Ameca splendens TaxID=208324 RepID=A0ABV0Z1P0_9TELE